MKAQKNYVPAGMKPLHGLVIPGEKTKLREKKLTDVRTDYRWQSDPELARLDAAPSLDMSFTLYLLDYTTAVHDHSPDRYPLAVETPEGKHIGNCTLYDIDEKRGEGQVGIMIGDKEYWSHGYGTDVMTTFTAYIFQNSNLNRLYLKTLDWNIRAQKCFTKAGFTQCGELQRDGYNFMLMELYRDQWEKRQRAGRENPTQPS
jgi:[ribosomal protein S5]-alanine N-acetyltransferase